MRYARILLLPMFICSIVLIIYGSSLTVQYLSDDYVFAYFARYATWEEMLNIFFPAANTTEGDGFYRPSGIFLWVIVQKIAGEAIIAQRALSIALHVLNGVLVYLLARMLGFNRRVTLLSAILFSCLPAGAEAVLWTSARFDLASTTWTLLFLLASLSRKARIWIPGQLLFMFALTTKEVAVTAPGLLILLMVLARHDLIESGWRSIAMRIMPAIGILSAYFVLRWVTFGGIGGYTLGDQSVLFAWSMPIHIGNFLNYLDALLAPLSIIPLARHSLEASLTTWFLAFIIAITSVIVLRSQHKSPSPASETPPDALAIGIGWILIAYPPLAGAAIGTSATFVETRHLYLPSVGISFIIAAILCTLRISVREYGTTRSLRYVRSILIVCIVLLCSVTTLTITQRWNNTSDTARQVTEDIQANTPTILPNTTFFIPALPDNQNGIFLFRNGIVDMFRIMYNDPTVRVASLNDIGTFTVPRPDRVVILDSRSGRISSHRDSTSIQTNIALNSQIPALRTMNYDNGFYPAESSPTDNWRWMQQQGCIHFTFAQRETIDLTLQSWSLGQSRTVRMVWNDRPESTYVIPPDPMTLQLTNLQATPGKNQLCFAADSTVSIQELLGTTDPRQVSIAVANFSPTMTPRLDGEPKPAVSRLSSFAADIDLLGYDIRTATPILPEQRIFVTMYWRARAQPDDLWAFLHIVDATGTVVAQIDGPPVPGFPTARWNTNEQWRYTHTVDLPATLKPGAYRIVVGLYDPATLERIAIQGGNSADYAIQVYEFMLINHPYPRIW